MSRLIIPGGQSSGEGTNCNLIFARDIIKPNASDFTSFNLDNIVILESERGVSLSAPGGGNQYISGIMQDVNDHDFSLIALIIYDAIKDKDYNRGGLAVLDREDSAIAFQYTLDDGAVQAQHYNDPATYHSTIAAQRYISQSWPLIWMKIMYKRGRLFLYHSATGAFWSMIGDIITSDYIDGIEKVGFITPSKYDYRVVTLASWELDVH